jgi:integrase
MLDLSPDYLKLMLLRAYYTGMCKGENLGLTGDRLDLKSGYIRLKETDTKSGEQYGIHIKLSVGWCGCAGGFEGHRA